MCRIFLILLIACACSSSEDRPPTEFKGIAMTIPYKILIGHPLNPNEKIHVQKIIDMVFSEIDTVHNKWNPHSELSQLNRLKKDTKIALSAPLTSLLQLSETIYRLSEKRFDPTIETIQLLWKENLQHKKIPQNEQLLPLLPAVGWENLHLRENIFWKDYDLTQLDLCGIAKGLAIDLLIEKLTESGFSNALVEWGGEIRAIGIHPHNRPWNIFISHMGSKDPNQAIATISLHNQAIATSGDYEQCWTVFEDEQEKIFFHVMDPKTCSPRPVLPGRLASATVLAPTCALADGLATAALLFDSLEEAEAWAKKLTLQNPALSFWFAVHKEGKKEDNDSSNFF